MADEKLEIDSNDKKAERSVLKCRMKCLLNSVEVPTVSSERCIYRVPRAIRQVNEAAYTPRIVSIGPIHHGDERLKPMEELKLGYLKAFLERTDAELEVIIDKLQEGEVRIRRCYAQNIPQSGYDFIRMILIDACFIIEHFLRRLLVDFGSKVDPILSNPWWKHAVRLDLILLENQLPFFVLEDIFTLTCRNSEYSSFLEISFWYFRDEELNFHNFRENYLMKKLPNGGCEQVEVRHFTDLRRIFFLPRVERQSKRELQSVKHLYSASQLVEAGVEFKVSENKSITEIQFENGELRIPQLEIYDSTETILRNMAALEQCHYPYDKYVTDYIKLLDFLINNSKDVDILVDKGIMINWVGDSNIVATMVNRLTTGLVRSNTSAAYLKLCDNLNDFYNRPLHKYKAIFMRDYFSTPWKIASFIAAVVLLLFTLIQTICAIISLVKQ